VLNNSQGDAILLVGATSDNNNFTSVSTINTNSSYYDINFSTAGIDGTWIIGINFANYSFEGEGGTVNLKEPSFGEIKFLEAINGSGTNLSSDVNVENNSIFVNSSANPGLNRSANISLYGLSFTEPKSQYSSDGTTYSDCTSSTDPACSNLSFSSNIFTFNVSHFTYFKSAEGYVATNNDDTPGSSSGGGGSISSYWTSTYIATGEEFESGFSKEMKVKHRIKIEVEKEIHHVGVIEINEDTDKVTLNISSETIQVTLGTGEDAKVDVTNDSYYDIYVLLNNIDKNSNKANITVQKIHEKIPDKEIANSNNEDNEKNEENRDIDIPTNVLNSNNDIVISLISLGVVILIVVFFWFKRNKKRK